MREHVEKIKLFLQDYQSQKFTGGIRMGFEEGKPMSFMITDVPEFKNKPIDEGFSIEKALKKATEGSFSGTLFFLLEDGKIKHHYYNKTIQGRKLIEELESYGSSAAPQVAEKRRILAVRKN